MPMPTARSTNRSARRRSDVIVVGGGLSGLACAADLLDRGLSVVILEASPRLGGRVCTDRRNGFQLDRGFQVLLEAYPETRARLDCGALDLRPFPSGATVRVDGAFHSTPNPFRRPSEIGAALRSPVGTFRDKLAVAKMALDLRRTPLDAVFGAPESSTRAALRERGFSERMIERFWRPFLGGVFLDPSLDTSSRMLDFVVKMFAEGRTVVPARGMGAIADQLADRVSGAEIRLQTSVTRVEPGRVTLESRETLAADAVVLATDGFVAGRLLGRRTPVLHRSVACMYFRTAHVPSEIADGSLVLNGAGEGPIATLVAISRVAPEYAPDGSDLISVSVVDPHAVRRYDLEREVRRQLEDWFGKRAERWDLLATYRLPRALPDQSLAAGGVAPRPVEYEPGLYVCGDHRMHGSIQGALASGGRAARVVFARLGSGAGAGVGTDLLPDRPEIGAPAEVPARDRRATRAGAAPGRGSGGRRLSRVR
jgi:phytoene dehydrogenase-like protein